ncbi:hypothetical protein WKK05_37320 (plasmid) [Nostoc sp. UHCC 0302]
MTEIPNFLKTQQGNICTRKAAVSEPKAQSTAAAPEESAETNAHTQVQVVGLLAQIACSRDSAQNLRISAFD